MKSDPQLGRLAQAKNDQQLQAAIEKADLAVIFRILLTQFKPLQLQLALDEAQR